MVLPIIALQLAIRATPWLLRTAIPAVTRSLSTTSLSKGLATMGIGAALVGCGGGGSEGSSPEQSAPVQETPVIEAPVTEEPIEEEEPEGNILNLAGSYNDYEFKYVRDNLGEITKIYIAPNDGLSDIMVLPDDIPMTYNLDNLSLKFTEGYFSYDEIPSEVEVERLSPSKEQVVNWLNEYDGAFATEDQRILIDAIRDGEGVIPYSVDYASSDQKEALQRSLEALDPKGRFTWVAVRNSDESLLHFEVGTGSKNPRQDESGVIKLTDSFETPYLTEQFGQISDEVIEKVTQALGAHLVPSGIFNKNTELFATSRSTTSAAATLIWDKVFGEENQHTSPQEYKANHFVHPDSLDDTRFSAYQRNYGNAPVIELHQTIAPTVDDSIIVYQSTDEYSPIITLEGGLTSPMRPETSHMTNVGQDITTITTIGSNQLYEKVYSLGDQALHYGAMSYARGITIVDSPSDDTMHLGAHGSNKTSYPHEIYLSGGGHDKIFEENPHYYIAKPGEDARTLYHINEKQDDVTFSLLNINGESIDGAQYTYDELQDLNLTGKEFSLRMNFNDASRSVTMHTTQLPDFVFDAEDAPEEVRNLNTQRYGTNTP